MFLDTDLSHTPRLVKTGLAILRQLRSDSRSLTQEVTRHLMQSLILNEVDHCTVAFAGLTQRIIILLQAVNNAGARLVVTDNSIPLQPPNKITFNGSE